MSILQLLFETTTNHSTGFLMFLTNQHEHSRFTLDYI